MPFEVQEVAGIMSAKFYDSSGFFYEINKMNKQNLI